MIVLHAAFCEGSLLFWAESSNDRKIARGARGKRPPIAWFDAGSSTLLATLAELGVHVDNKRATRPAIAWLPSAENRAIPSAALIGDDAPPADSAGLTPWTVITAPLTVSQSIDVLAACAAKRLLHPGLLVGADVAYWAAALRFAAALVARGQFLPGLTIWQPVISGPDTA